MYALEITCLNCKETLIFEREQLWRIVILSNELELKILEQKLCCNPCQQVGPMKLVVRNIYMSALIFEKIISVTIPDTSSHIYNKPSVNNPCILCCATGKINVKYKAHKKIGSFKGVLVEECPACEGKGYFK